MLQLTAKMVGHAGVKYWRQARPGCRVRTTFLAWEDLVLAQPRVRWPEFCRPTQQPDWDQGVRIVWLAEQHRFHYVLGCSVPDFPAVTSDWKNSGVAVERTIVRPGTTPLTLLGADGRSVGSLSFSVRRRLELALEKRVPSLILRVLTVCGLPVLVVGKDENALAIAALASPPSEGS